MELDHTDCLHALNRYSICPVRHYRARDAEYTLAVRHVCCGMADGLDQPRSRTCKQWTVLLKQQACVENRQPQNAGFVLEDNNGQSTFIQTDK